MNGWPSGPSPALNRGGCPGTGRLGLAGEVLQHLLLALVGAGPLAVATDVPDHIVGQVLVHPGRVAPLQRLEAFPDDGDVGMLVVGHGDSFRRRPLGLVGGSLPWSATRRETGAE